MADTIRHPKKRAFLAAFALTGNVTAAAERARVDRSMHYAWLADDPAYGPAFAAAQDEAADRLETEARRRAVEGLVRKKFTRSGEPIIDPATGAQYEEHEYSDPLLLQLLKATRPEKYRERSSVEHSGPGGGPIPQELTIRDDELRRAEDAFFAALGVSAAESGAVGSDAGDHRPPDQGPHPV